MEHDHEGHERLFCKFTHADETWNLRWERTRHRSQEKNDCDPAPQERQDVDMPVKAPVESASVKRGSDVVADKEERARL